MAELVKVVVDAMGGDLAPVEPVKAAVEAVKERKFLEELDAPETETEKRVRDSAGRTGEGG